MPNISRGTSMEASTNTSEPAQNESCCQTSCRKARFSGVRRRRAWALTTRPAATTPVTPETSKWRSQSVYTR